MSRNALEQAVVRGVTASGYTVVLPADVVAQLSDEELRCAREDCWIEVGRRLKVANFLVGTVDKRAGWFGIRLRVIRGSDGRTADTEERRCYEDECSIAETLRLATHDVVSRTRQGPTLSTAKDSPQRTASKQMSSLSGSVPLVEPLPRAGASLPASGSTPDNGSAGRPWIGIAGLASLVTGAAVFTTGAFLVKLDGDCVLSHCSDLYDAKWWGLGFMGVGAVGMTVGALLVLPFVAPKHAPAILGGVTTNGIFLRGRF